MKGYCSEANFERLRRCEELAEEKNVRFRRSPWPGSTRRRSMYCNRFHNESGRMQENTASLELSLTEAEARWLDLETDSR
jgi:hypothetical protein